MNRLKKITFLLLSTIIGFGVFSGAVFAQQITATVSGTISDQNGAVVQGATVTALSNETGQTKTAVTGDGGVYTITFLPPGTYNITVEKTGFANVVRENIRLEIAQTASIDVALGVTAGEVSVDVGSDETPILQTETSNLETTIEAKLIEDLPTADRNIFNFVNLVPGTIDAGSALGNPGSAVGSAGNRNFFDSNFSVSGGRASSNDILLDGVTNTIGDFGGVAISPPQDSI
ncbi:MAG: carboxypeptidase-like regulatory domain-containing protein, partial [Acidobacteriota bacterium]|nr:carboxypeptidase-like regulatory domain-containing protein [Acidobacteriota bacterium]